MAKKFMLRYQFDFISFEHIKIHAPVLIIYYSTDQKKLNRECVCDQERNGYRTGTGTHAERKQNAKQNGFCQVFPVSFLLIGTVLYSSDLRGFVFDSR